MQKTRFERDQAGRIRIHVLPTDRFKTFAISAYIGAPLAEETVTPTALTPFVLRRGTESLRETKAFREKLDDLFGAGFGFDIYKRGDYQIVQFRMDIIEDRYVSGNESLLKQGLAFLGEAITRPALDNGIFVSKYVEAEKITLRKKLESIINDKIRYAAERCIAEMCKDEVYRLHQLGIIEAIDAITPQSLYDAYVHWLQTSPIDLYVIGNTTLEEVKALAGEAFSLNRGTAPAYQYQTVHKDVETVRTVVEELDVNQGKLNMGLRAYTTYADEDYAAALVYNGILGAYPHSKLFANVREKASLAYYASSRLDGHKGILTIQSGIEIENYEKALSIIQEQLAALKNGEISGLELDQTLAMIRNQLKEMEDSAFEIIAFDFNTVLSGKERSVQSLIAEVENVNKDAVRKIAEQVKLDTVYFLRNRKGE